MTAKHGLAMHGTGVTISAVVCTRNRGAAIAATVRGILANDHASFELWVIDQSTDDTSEDAIAEWLADPRLHYFRSGNKGVARARNIGISAARAEFIAMTDDDCEVSRDWLESMSKSLSSAENIGVVFGNVVSGPHDAGAGFISAYLRESTFVATSMRDKPEIEGIGACMGIRKSVWKALGGFDEMLGAGSRFESAEETDFVIRALMAGYNVCETPHVSVIHHGFRTWNEGRRVISGYLFGIGATLGKHVRCGNWSILHVVRALAVRWMFEGPAVDFGFMPSRYMRLSGFVRGFGHGFVTPVDRDSAHFSK